MTLQPQSRFEAPAAGDGDASLSDDFLDGRQEGLYEACLIVDRIAMQNHDNDAVHTALESIRGLLRNSIHTTDPEAIRNRIAALAAGLPGREL